MKSVTPARGHLSLRAHATCNLFYFLFEFYFILTWVLINGRCLAWDVAPTPFGFLLLFSFLLCCIINLCCILQEEYPNKAVEYMYIIIYIFILRIFEFPYTKTDRFPLASAHFDMEGNF